ncbi:MAG: phosphoribosyl-ATP diphosphatase [Oscillospiraceae bacterium]|nr:MAG: phosphoribosyl-ATP diphosphatase [Oscillospiraceae bacterium]
MNDVMEGLYQVVLDRRSHPLEGSYTCYLFEKGLDKICKKVGEEASEVIIAAKNGDNSETAGEICDLLYHLLVLMAQQGISTQEITAILEQRRQKIGNLKVMHQSDHQS